MSRSYQEIGLRKEAISFLDKNAKKKPSLVCPDCGKVISEKIDYEVYDFEDVFYGDGATLRKYFLKDGKIAKEVIQAMPWSNGPIGFFCLEINNKLMFKWEDVEIEKFM